MVDRRPGGPRAHRYWATPPDLMASLDAEFHFDYDPCPHPRPDGYNGLTAEWGQSNWVNPPFIGGTAAWVTKAIEEHAKGKDVVFIMPTFRSMYKLIEAGAEVRAQAPVRWISLEDGSPSPKVNGQVLLLFILRGTRQ